ncbi:MAG: hypothetical protein ABF682_10285 [Liquorilactobacillus sp.]|uniref:hypothetical protein n=1 Tax=Liquorilactobacillus TaxID=2767888 RepID=UPI0039ED775F
MAKSKLIKTNKKIADTVVGLHNKIKDGVVGGYSKVEDKFIDQYLTKDGESVEDARKRVNSENKDKLESMEKQQKEISKKANDKAFGK